MSKPVRILGIAGSLWRDSYNRAALRAAVQLVPEGATIDVFELDGIPGFKSKTISASRPAFRERNWRSARFCRRANSARSSRRLRA